MLLDLFINDKTPIIENETLLLRAGRISDHNEWRSLRLENKNYLMPFEPQWHEKDLTKKAFKRRLSSQKIKSANNNQYVFFIFQKDKPLQKLVGSISLSNIRYNAAFHVNIGYWMSEAKSNQGIMTQSVALLLPFIFEELKLQRANAACLIHNIASRKLLEKNGFEEEGIAKDYLQINGHWQDHMLYGLTRRRFLQENDVYK